MYREKAWRELHKNAISHIEQILEATSHSSYKATCFQSNKQSKLDEQDMNGTAGEARKNT